MAVNPLSSSQKESKDKQKRFNFVSAAPTDIATAPVGQKAAAGTPTSSGSFTNLQSYLDANKDQSEGLGAKIEQNIEGTANEGRTALSQSQKEFDTKTEESGIDRNKLSSNALSSIIQKGYDSPSQLNDDDVNAFSTIRTKNEEFSNSADSGPKSLSDLSTYQAAKDKFSQATEKANLTGSEAGRETLLRDTFKRPDYTKGQSGLDQLLVQNTDKNRERLEGLRTGLLGNTGLVSEDNKAIQAANERRALEAKEVQDAYTDQQDLLYNPNAKEELTTVKQYVDPRLPLDPTKPVKTDEQGRKYYEVQANKYGALTQEETAANALAKQLSDAQKINYDKALADAAGVNQSMQTLGADIRSAVQKNSNFDANLANSLTDEQFARIQALNKLAGRDLGKIGDANLSGLAKDRFDTSASLNKNLANKLIADKAAVFKSDFGNAINQIENSRATDYKFGGETLAGQASDIINRSLGGAIRPIEDAPEAEKVIKSYETGVSQLNATRAKYGLEPLDVNSFYPGGNKEAAIQDAVRKMADAGRGGYGTDFVVNAINNGADGMWPGGGPAGRNGTALKNAQQVAYLRALQNLMEANKRQLANPTQKMSGSGAPVGGKAFVS